jgi:hypothetical protein
MGKNITPPKLLSSRNAKQLAHCLWNGNHFRGARVYTTGEHMKALLLCFFLSVTAFSFKLPENCHYDKECLIEVPGMVCADGTPSYITLTARRGASNLLIYLSGGGACWNATTCRLGYARPLTRKDPDLDWNDGEGIHNSKDGANPFRQEYNIVSVPYCTGDVYAGNSEVQYGSKIFPYLIRHRGYTNAEKAIEKAQALIDVDTPKKVVLLGRSAGGIGTYVHMGALDRAFPLSKKYVISDAGLPFRPPFIKLTGYETVMKNWGVGAILPQEPFAPKDFGELLRYNRLIFPHIRFGLISSYGDRIMSFFAQSVGAVNSKTAVRDTLVDVANNQLGIATNAKVFYLDDSQHTYTGHGLSSITSMGVTLQNWIEGMLADQEGTSWDNIRPDLHYAVKTNEEYLAPTTIEEANQLYSGER